MPAAMEDNLLWYMRLRLAMRALVWLPAAFLYFQARFGLDGALQLSGIYYLAVVVAEVPSGWMSDRFGRVLTLRLSAVSLLAAQLLFVLTASFTAYVVGQILVALWFAFASGTDVSLHFDSLEALGRTSQFAAREARIARAAYAVTALAALAGGGLGAMDLRWPFAAAVVVAAAQLAIAWRLVEPPRTEASLPLIAQVRRCLTYLRRPLLAWLFLYAVAQITLEHLSVEIGPAYLAELLGESADQLQNAPLLTGILMAVVAIVGSAAASRAVAVRDRLGLVGALLILATVEAGIAVALALTVSSFVVPLMTLRSVQPAIANVLVPSAVSPLVDSAHRATYLSLGSFGGRLGYGIVLLGLGTADDLDTVRLGIGVVALVVLGIVVATSGMTHRGSVAHG